MDMSALHESGIVEINIPGGRDRGLLLTPDAGEFVFEVRRGLIAVDGQAAPNVWRIIDLLLPGDVLSSSVLTGLEKVRLRAIEDGSVLRQPKARWVRHADTKVILFSCESLALRAHVANAIVALDEIDARVASFVLALAVRFGASGKSASDFELRMPREDVADCILVNPDTLSRAFTRLRAAGILVRNKGNHLAIRNWGQLVSSTPLADMILEAFGHKELQHADG